MPSTLDQLKVVNDALIPAESTVGHRLNAPTVSFYVWIVKLSKDYGYCWATNGYLARVQGRSESQVGRRIATLIAAGWLRREFVNGERHLYPVVLPPTKTSRFPSSPREKVPLCLVPAPGYAEEASEKCVPSRRKVRTLAAKSAYPHIDASLDASLDACTDNNTTLPPAPPEQEVAAVVVAMRKIGVWSGVAQEIAKALPPSEIQRILADPACHKAERPAAWFVSVIKAGYQSTPPKSTPTMVPSPPKKTPVIITTPEKPEIAIRREDLQAAYGLNGRELVRAVISGLTKGLHHQAQERERPRRIAETIDTKTNPEHRLRCVPKNTGNEHSCGQEEGEAATRWQEIQARFAALATQQNLVVP